MLQLTIPKQELYDEETGTFLVKGPYKLTMEHSLLSISKWESKWNKPFINNSEDKTKEEIFDYIKCMTVNGHDEDGYVYRFLTDKNIKEIEEYISAPMTGTKFYEFSVDKSHSKNKPITSEEIYYKMFSYGIPMECQKWHINRLLTLLRVFDVKNDDQKMSKAEASAAYRRLNAERRKKMNSKG